MSYDPTNQEGFERWANTQGLVLTAAQGVDLMFRTYEDWHTEFAWRGWANRPHRETRVNIADRWPTPVRAEGVMGIPPNPPGSGSAKASDLPMWNVRIDGGDDTAIRDAAARASAEMPDAVCEPLRGAIPGTLRIGNTPLTEFQDKTIKDCVLRFPHVADTVYVGAVPCESVAGENFRNAVRALVDRLPKNPQTLAAYFLADELLAVHKLLGDE